MTSPVASGPAAQLLGLYDEALGEVYGYALARCRNRAIAEDVTSDTFMGAVDSIKRGAVGEVTIAWLVAIARYKLVDHWRRTAREERKLEAVANVPETTATVDDAWDQRLDVLAARDVLDQLGAHHRMALTLRYLDGLPVADVATVLGRTLHATEALLVRARKAFRDRYEEVSA